MQHNDTPQARGIFYVCIKSASPLLTSVLIRNIIVGLLLPSWLLFSCFHFNSSGSCGKDVGFCADSVTPELLNLSHEKQIPQSKSCVLIIFLLLPRPGQPGLSLACMYGYRHSAFITSFLRKVLPIRRKDQTGIEKNSRFFYIIQV